MLSDPVRFYGRKQQPVDYARICCFATPNIGLLNLEFFSKNKIYIRIDISYSLVQIRLANLKLFKRKI